MLLETIVAGRMQLVDISIAPIAMDEHTLTASPVDAQEPKENPIADMIQSAMLLCRPAEQKRNLARESR